MSTRLATIVLCLAPIAACASTEDLDKARSQERRAEAILADVESLPVGTPGRAELVADAAAEERDLERARMALEALQRDRLIGTGIDAAAKGARGDYFGVLEILGGLATAGATYLLARSKGDSETARRIADLERRRDESRAQQGIAGASERSATQARSAVALAAQQAQRAAESERWRVARLQSTGLSGSFAPTGAYDGALDDLSEGLN